MTFSRLARLAAALVTVAAAIAGGVIAQQRSAGAMATAATRFLESLTPDQRQQATFPIESDEWVHWNFIPTSQFPRNGLPIKNMTEPQRSAAHNLLKAAVSQHGYVTATSIMDLENVLKAIEVGGTIVRDPELYFFSIFGTPSSKNTWGLRIEGHHLSLHFTIANGTMVEGAPEFFGSNPAEVRDGPKKGTRVLANQMDTGRALLDALDASQRTTAVITNVAPNDIVTRTNVKIDPLSPTGLTAGAMTQPQRDLLMKVIEAYTSKMPDEVAAGNLARIRQAGIEKVAFAWAGETEPGKKHYYRVQGPTFLIEFDNTQNDGNHIHSVWRDFDRDFGRDVLKEHVKLYPH